MSTMAGVLPYHITLRFWEFGEEDLEDQLSEDMWEFTSPGKSRQVTGGGFRLQEARQRW